MSSATPTRVRPQVAGEAVQTSWSKIFPNKVDSKNKSLQFTKKLVAVAVSNIAYIRDIFPEVAFANKSLDKMPIKILKQHNECEDAGIAASWLLGAFEAIEKEYLKVLLVLYCIMVMALIKSLYFINAILKSLKLFDVPFRRKRLVTA